MGSFSTIPVFAGGEKEGDLKRRALIKASNSKPLAIYSDSSLAAPHTNFQSSDSVQPSNNVTQNDDITKDKSGIEQGGESDLSEDRELQEYLKSLEQYDPAVDEQIRKEFEGKEVECTDSEELKYYEENPLPLISVRCVGRLLKDPRLERIDPRRVTDYMRRGYEFPVSYMKYRRKFINLPDDERKLINGALMIILGEEKYIYAYESNDRVTLKDFLLLAKHNFALDSFPDDSKMKIMNILEKYFIID